jgi:hypothetical protein
MNKGIWLAALLALAVSLTACKKKEEPVETAPEKKASAEQNAGDRVARDIHDKLDKAKAAGDAVEKSGQVQDDALKAATEEAGGEKK